MCIPRASRRILNQSINIINISNLPSKARLSSATSNCKSVSRSEIHETVQDVILVTMGESQVKERRLFRRFLKVSYRGPG